MLSSPRRTIRVLATDGGYKHTLAVVRYLGREGMRTDVIGGRRCLGALSRYGRCSAYPYDRFNTAHIDAIARFLQVTRYDVVLAIGARSVRLLSDNRDRFLPYTGLILGPKKAIDLAMDKIGTHELAISLGINSPQTWIIRTKDSPAIPPVPSRFFVLKRANELHRGQPVYVSDPEAVRRVVDAWQCENESMPIVQEYIEGVGEGFFALYDRGICRRVFMHRRIRQTPPSGGASCCAVSIFEDDLMRAGRRILDHLEWHGVAMVEFKRDLRTGKLYLMEINAKFWGSLDLALVAGVNFPALAVRVALGDEIGYSEKYRLGLKFHWPFDGGEITHLSCAPQSFGAILKDCLDPRVKSNLWLLDPLPGLISGLRAARQLVSTVLRNGRLL